MRLVSSPARRLLGALVGSVIALCASPALAGFQSNITVKLIAPGGITGDPTPINLSQLVTTANFATGVHTGGGGPIDSWMLAGEEVTFVGETIHVRAYAGAETPAGSITGYLGAGGNHARYEFDGLSIAGKTIVGVGVTSFDGYAASGASGLAPSVLAANLVHLIDADTISLYLDDILFADRGPTVGSSEDHADFLITLITRDNGTGPGPTDPGNGVPEPATLALFMVAALGASAARRRA
ncbi:PEP-CTERM sorting domain-containing protein [Roseateles sp. DXS20W]|uniref:PEP-CTERM sorting domain-containing protein n=1 Tax=Pelomonas lactea TaxID=3299030 RepID=A0ABW7GE55_9BURK